MFSKKKQEVKEVNPLIDFSRLPKHIAFIMDGNGRWAKAKGKPRTYGHKIGAESMGIVIRHARELGIKIVSFFAFSTENWNRPKDEVDEIFNIATRLLKSKKQSFVKSDMKLTIIGDKSKLPAHLVKEIDDCMELTKNNKGLIVNVAINYGGRAEIVRAVNNIIKDKLSVVDECTFAKYLQTYPLLDPDLVIRTSGEQRLSNFMMYQSAYSELYFPKTAWPDFREKELEEAIVQFQSRDRRFGAIKEDKGNKK